jgi:hypothetical protein
VAMVSGLPVLMASSMAGERLVSMAMVSVGDRVLGVAVGGLSDDHGAGPNAFGLAVNPDGRNEVTIGEDRCESATGLALGERFGVALEGESASGERAKVESGELGGGELGHGGLRAGRVGGHLFILSIGAWRRK